MGEWKEKTKLQKKEGKNCSQHLLDISMHFRSFQKKNATIAVNLLTGNVQF